MRSYYKSPLFLKIVSLVCAIILWVYVIQIENPAINIVVSAIPIKYINQDIMENNQLMLVSEKKESITVTVRGRRNDITGLNARNISATVDLKAITSSHEFTLPIQIAFPTGNASVVNYNDMYINFEADVKTEVVKPIIIEKKGIPPDDYLIGVPVSAKDTVKITGPKKVIDSVIVVQADLDITSRKDNIDENIPLKLVDRFGGVIKSQYITLGNEQVNVKCTVHQMKTLPLYVDTVFYDENGNEKNEKNYNVVPNKIKVAGTPQALEELVEISAGRININDYAGSESVVLDLILPEGVINIDNTFTVELVLNHDMTLNREITLTNFDIDRLGYNLRSELLDTSLVIQVSGDKGALSELSAGDFTAKIDLNDLGEGTHNVPVNILCNKQGVTIKKEYTLRVKLTSSL